MGQHQPDPHLTTDPAAGEVAYRMAHGGGLGTPLEAATRAKKSTRVHRNGSASRHLADPGFEFCSDELHPARCESEVVRGETQHRRRRESPLPVASTPIHH